MQILNLEFSPDKFYMQLKASVKSILMLDYDGTLSPFTPDRDNAEPYDGVKDRLSRLMGFSKTEVIIISGRDIDTLKKLLGLQNPPQIWGCHGAERYIPNLGYKIMVGQKVRDGLLEIKKWSKENALIQYAEFKPSGVAFHWRGKTENELSKIRNTVQNRWSPKVSQYNLTIKDFDGGIEIRAKDFDKGIAVKNIMKVNSPDFAIAYMGDDITDEDAFRAIGKNGLKVLVREQRRDTLADIQINPPDELLEFLDKWIELTSSNN